jgi:hypothetical protein
VTLQTPVESTEADTTALDSTAVDPAVAAKTDVDSIEIEHPALGPAVAVYDDRRNTRKTLITSVIFILAGALGTVLGLTDLPGGKDRLTNIMILVAGIGLIAFGVNETLSMWWRLRSPVRLLVGKRGFGCSITPDVIRWSEVDSIAFERVARGKPKAVRVKLADSAAFTQRHELTRRARWMLKLNDGSVYVGRGTKVAPETILDLMSERLTANMRASTPPRPTQRVRHKGPNR